MSSVATTTQFVWCDGKRCELRDSSGGLTTSGKQWFSLGQVNYASGTPTSYFYTTDHLGSVREMTLTAGTIEAQYGYDPYGVKTNIVSETVPADFQYAGYYVHSRSGLNFTRTRAYSAALGRFINRDPIGRKGGVNLYSYVRNNPILRKDPSGLRSTIDGNPHGHAEGDVADPDDSSSSCGNGDTVIGAQSNWTVIAPPSLPKANKKVIFDPCKDSPECCAYQRNRCDAECDRLFLEGIISSDAHEECKSCCDRRQDDCTSAGKGVWFDPSEWQDCIDTALQAPDHPR